MPESKNDADRVWANERAMVNGPIVSLSHRFAPEILRLSSDRLIINKARKLEPEETQTCHNYVSVFSGALACSSLVPTAVSKCNPLVWDVPGQGCPASVRITRGHFLTFHSGTPLQNVDLHTSLAGNMLLSAARRKGRRNGRHTETSAALAHPALGIHSLNSRLKTVSQGPFLEKATACEVLAATTAGSKQLAFTSLNCVRVSRSTGIHSLTCLDFEGGRCNKCSYHHRHGQVLTSKSKIWKVEKTEISQVVTVYKEELPLLHSYWLRQLQ